MGSKARAIEIRNAHHHNLRHLDLDIPQDKLVVITGLSGSGKSSLAFDILFAEGQRRFVDSLSAYARQYIRILERPQVDRVENIPPTVAIEQRVTQGNQKSTVATATEIYHYLRLLYAKLGVQYCPDCDQPILAQTQDQILDDLDKRFGGKPVVLLAPLVRAKKGTHREILERARKSGIRKFRVDGEFYAEEAVPSLRRYVEHDIEAVVFRKSRTAHAPDSLADAVDQALAIGEGSLVALGPRLERYYDLKRACPKCQQSYEEPDPRIFSFNSRYGACETCNGVGHIERFDPALLVPDPRRSIRDGAIELLQGSAKNFALGTLRRRLNQRVRTLAIDSKKPWKTIPLSKRKKLIEGEAPDRQSQPSGGLLDWLAEIHQDASGELAERLGVYRSRSVCSACHGSRIRDVARAIRIQSKGIHELVSQTPTNVRGFLRQCSQSSRFQSEKARRIAEPLMGELDARLELLSRVGLDYLHLNRSADTLSGGEAQRIRLASQLGSRLRGVCYVLDEPTIGLHARDNALLLSALRDLQQAGNSVVIVEHDEQTIRNADHVIDLGPGGGDQGGQIIAQGTPEELARSRSSITARHLERPPSRIHPARSLPALSNLRVSNAHIHNLKALGLDVPLGRLTAVTGVSGSGKSTLVRDVLFRGLRALLRGRSQDESAQLLGGLDPIQRVLEVDQTPIGKTPRSIPASYVGFWDEIRKLFAATPMAKVAGFLPGRFSFNVKGGRCEHCAGQGQIKMEMSFLPNVYVGCEVCQGRRYNPETLAVEYRGKSIADVLDMRVVEAESFFGSVTHVHRPLSLLNQIGLGYLTLGQASNTLSGGESQRIKIAYELAKPSRTHTMYLLDEPTTGLHMADVERLIGVLHSLVDSGHTVVVIEHNLDVIANADCVVDLGPEGGEAGGELVFWGSPEELARHPGSHTGKALRDASGQRLRKSRVSRKK